MIMKRWPFWGVPFVVFCVAQPVAAEWQSGEEAIMGTAVRVELWAEDKKAGEGAIAAVMAEMHRVDRAWSPYKPESELSQVNQLAATRAVNVSGELVDLIRRSLKLSEQTGGAFDITFSSVGYLYDYRKGVRPSEAEIQAALPAISYRHLLLDEARRTLRFARKGVRIDLGGIAKGYAVDRGIEILKSRGFQSALVSAGGDSRILGDRRGRPWIIGIRDPRDEKGVVARLPLQNEAISTSGDYERYFESEGVRYHHIINPKTGRSVSEIRSTTVIGPDATTTDGLSTSVFVLGVKEGLALIDRSPGTEAVIIDSAGKMHFSSGLARLDAKTPSSSIAPNTGRK